MTGPRLFHLLPLSLPLLSMAIVLLGCGPSERYYEVAPHIDVSVKLHRGCEVPEPGGCSVGDWVHHEERCYQFCGSRAQEVVYDVACSDATDPHDVDACRRAGSRTLSSPPAMVPDTLALSESRETEGS